jgi:hypothetical protein
MSPYSILTTGCVVEGSHFLPDSVFPCFQLFVHHNIHWVPPVCTLPGSVFLEGHRENNIPSIHRVYSFIPNRWLWSWWKNFLINNLFLEIVNILLEFRLLNHHFKYWVGVLRLKLNLIAIRKTIAWSIFNYFCFFFL